MKFDEANRMKLFELDIKYHHKSVTIYMCKSGCIGTHTMHAQNTQCMPTGSIL